MKIYKKSYDYITDDIWTSVNCKSSHTKCSQQHKVMNTHLPKKSLEICCDHSGAFIFELIFFILADNKINYKSLNEFVFFQDSITYYGVSCP